ncbi:hypothetical protein M0657_005902 [Pyricularia oryzae]|uniref:Uncharacterized protein n=3 Tax=Pyricularia oryzae TaxID=318829 RepID=A0A4P7NHY7_PYROR|nr:hypothetical protein OOU_Y34scaffold00748g16 [Pyricularia oryzae Y34]KAI7921699.1 hypothetical protein M9X92_005224 [Pyricularia oryzae]KAI7921844.1 hypothetical protein M0657_005902 [Pyricularia oryzae]QBZ61594.1 hypothetical protein PoMZ_08547 [Pyricularia oryzae]
MKGGCRWTNREAGPPVNKRREKRVVDGRRCPKTGSGIRRRRDGERKRKQARTGVDDWPALRVLSDVTRQGLFCVRWPTRMREV